MKTDHAGDSSPQSQVARLGRGIIGLRYLGMLAGMLLCLSTAAGWAEVVDAVARTIVGKVEWAKPGTTQFEPLRAGDHLAVGSTIRTGKDGVATVVTVPGAAVRIGADSELVLNALEFAKAGQKVTKRHAELDLKSGTVSALIKNNEPDVTRFEIKTPHGVAAARGTFYGVTVEKDRSFVLCKEGKVGLQKATEGEKSSEGK